MDICLKLERYFYLAIFLCSLFKLVFYLITLCKHGCSLVELWIRCFCCLVSIRCNFSVLVIGDREKKVHWEWMFDSSTCWCYFHNLSISVTLGAVSTCEGPSAGASVKGKMVNSLGFLVEHLFSINDRYLISSIFS